MFQVTLVKVILHGESSSIFLSDFATETFQTFANLSLMKKIGRDQSDVFVFPLTYKHFGSVNHFYLVVDFVDWKRTEKETEFQQNYSQQ